MSEALPRLIGAEELCRLIPYSARHLSRLEKCGQFPRRVRLGRRVAWVEAEVRTWIEEHTASRNAGSRV